MDINFGQGKTEFGPGLEITLDGNEITDAIESYLRANEVTVKGKRVITIDGKLINRMKIYINPSGFVVEDGKKYSGRGG